MGTSPGVGLVSGRLDGKHAAGHQRAALTLLSVRTGHVTSSLLSPRYQCFKSAWMYEVLHSGFRFPLNYPDLRTAQLVYDKEVQWTLGAILYKTRFLPLRWGPPDTRAHASMLPAQRSQPFVLSHTHTPMDN